MKAIKIKFNPNGSMHTVDIDFKIYRGEYNQVELMVYIPKSLLLDTVIDENGNLLTGNIVKVGAIIHKANGQAYTTKEYNIPVQEEQRIDNITYAIYCRRLPKEFTLWETVATELGERGELQMVFNLLQMRQENNQTIVESILTSPIIAIPIYPSVYLSVDEAIETDKMDELAGNIDTLRVIVQNDMATKLELKEVDTNKVDKVQAEEGKLLLSNGNGGIQASDVGIQEYEDQKGYIDRLHTEQEQRMDNMQVEIAENSKERHNHTNKKLIDGYTVPNSEILESVDKMHKHTNKEILDSITEAFTTALKGNVESSITNVEIDSNTGIFTFTKNNGEKVTVDTLLEKVIVNFEFNTERKALILISEDGTRQEIELGALLSMYNGTDGAEIAVTIDRVNNIGASIKAGAVSTNKLADHAVTEQKLSTDIVDKLSMIFPKEEIVDLIYPIGMQIEFAIEFDPNKKWTWTKWERVVDRRFALPVEEGKVGDVGGSETHTLTVAELAPHDHTQDEHNHYLDLPRKWGFNPAGDQNWLGWAGGDRGGENRQRYSNGVRPNIHSTGEGKAFSIMNPYVGVAKWKRIE